jgi:hemolysin activation/secretion protein
MVQPEEPDEASLMKTVRRPRHFPIRQHPRLFFLENVTLDAWVASCRHAVIVFSVIVALTASFCLPAIAETDDSSPVSGEDLTGRPEANRLSSLQKIFVKKINVKGTTVFSAEELAGITSPYENREITYEELETLRQAITLFYINKGYISSGAVIHDQSVIDGNITITVIEGSLSEIEVAGNRYFRSAYIRDRLAMAADPPINIQRLQETLQMLQQDRRIKKINAELRPGILQGESNLFVKVEENRPYAAILKCNNNQSPSIGPYRGEAQLSHQNVFGLGDVLDATIGLTEGATDYSASYSLPLTPRDMVLEFHYRKSNSTVVEDIFKRLDIESRTDTYGLTLSRPFYRSPAREFRLAMTAEMRENSTFLLGIPFSFSEGTDEGRSKVTVVRFSQEWISRSPIDVIAARSNFSLGLGILGATTHDHDADGRFLTWLYQLQWIRQLSDEGMQLRMRVDGQLAADSLLSLEKFSVGGMYSVRGYRENQLVRDNGLSASLEFRMPVIHDRTGVAIVQLAPFADFGRSWNTGKSTPDPKSISSVGAGIVWAVTQDINLQVYWGIPLRSIESSGNTLQDHGIHFQITGNLF